LTTGSAVRSGVRSEAVHTLKSGKKLNSSWLVRRLILTPNRTSGEIESIGEQTEIPGEQPTIPMELSAGLRPVREESLVCAIFAAVDQDSSRIMSLLRASTTPFKLVVVYP